MFKFIRSLFYFSLGRKVTRGAARAFGLGHLAPVIGVIGGLRSMRRHS